MKRETKRRLARLAPKRNSQMRVIFVTDDEPVPPLATGETEEDRIVFCTIYETKPEHVR